MSDLIERKSIRNLYSCLDSEDKVRVAQVLMDIDAIPTIDAVEVVRCKDCKWRKACKVFSQQQITDDSYCSWGEREGE